MIHVRSVKVRAFCTTTLASMLLFAAEAGAQTLPLRNLQIEVRQVQSSATETSGAQGTLRVRGTSDGAAADGSVQLSARQSQQSGSALQTALVLNGYAARVDIGAQQPLRFLQTVTRNGQTFLSLGTLLVQAGTGFAATPRWNGGDTVELEFSARQRINESGAAPLASQATVSSMLLVPIGTWSTVAQSEDSSEGSTGNLLSSGSSHRKASTEVQVRISLR